MIKVHPLPDCSNQVGVHDEILIVGDDWNNLLANIRVHGFVVVKMTKYSRFDRWQYGAIPGDISPNITAQKSLALEVYCD